MSKDTRQKLLEALDNPNVHDSGCFPNLWKELAETTSHQNLGPVITDYSIREKIGQGGMGQVWSASKISDETEVAIKTMRTGGSAEDIKRFTREIEIQKNLQSQYLVGVIDHGQCDTGEYYIVMPLFHETLADLLLAPASLTAREILDGALCISQALEELHADKHQLVHRDLKPSNIFIKDNGDWALADFGITRTNQTRITATGIVQGTLEYLDPEVLEKGWPQQLDLRSDIYAFGVILFELLYGRLPFRIKQTETDVQFKVRVLKDLPDFDTDRPGHVSDDLIKITQWCLQKDPKERYQSASEITADLKRIGGFKQIEGPKLPKLRVRSPWAIGNMTLGLYVFVGGDTKNKYEFPDGIVAKHSSQNFQFQDPLIKQCKDSLIDKRRAEAKQKNAMFHNGLAVRIDNYLIGASDDIDESPWPLYLDTSVTDFFHSQSSHNSLQEMLEDSRTVRSVLVKDSYPELSGCGLSNPICTNLSIVTGDNQILYAKRGQRVATNPDGWSPAVSGTANPEHDCRDGNFDPWSTALREARQEVMGELSTAPENVVFFGLARVSRNGYPFLFGELRTNRAAQEVLNNPTILDKYESKERIAVPFTIDDVTKSIRELYEWRHPNTKEVTSVPHTTILSLLMSLLYEYPKKYDEIVEKLTWDHQINPSMWANS